MAPPDVRDDVEHEQRDPVTDVRESQLTDAPVVVSSPAEVHALGAVTTVAPGRAVADAPEARVVLVFSRQEMQALEAAATRAGTSVPDLVRRRALMGPDLRPAASLRPTNLPSNPPFTPETSSGIRVRGYSGAYTPVVGRNR
jgi:hypothetical protein